MKLQFFQGGEAWLFYAKKRITEPDVGTVSEYQFWVFYFIFLKSFVAKIPAFMNMKPEYKLSRHRGSQNLLFPVQSPRTYLLLVE